MSAVGPLGGNARARLRALVGRVERLWDDKDALGDDLKEVYAEVNGEGMPIRFSPMTTRFRESTLKPLCIYHGHCDDGFAAAWAVRHAVGPDLFEFYPGVYQQTPPDVTNRHVLFVDFSYKRPVLLEMAQQALSIVILDHHKTAAEDLADFREPAPYADWHESG